MRRCRIGQTGEDPEPAFDAFKELTRGKLCDYSGLSYAKLRGSPGIQWPCTNAAPNGTARLYVDGVFHTLPDQCEDYGHDLLTGAARESKDYVALDPRGRAFLHAADCVPPAESTRDEFPLQLVTGRTVYHWHTRTKTGRVEELNAAAPDLWVELAPVDADKLDVGEGDVVRVESPRGAVEGRARLTGGRPGVVFVPFHFGSWNDPSDRDPNERAANELTPAAWDPVSKQPLLKSGAVRVTRVAASGGVPAPAPSTTASEPALASRPGGRS